MGISGNSAPTITFPRILGIQVPAEVETTQTGIVNVVILWTATVIDDGSQSTLRYQWEFDGGLQFSDETTNPATLLNYVTTATGNIKLTVTDNNGTGGSSSVTLAD